MRSNKIVMTTLAVVLGGFAGVSVADPAFVNLDYSIHADNVTCKQVTTDTTPADGYADSGDWVEAGELTKDATTVSVKVLTAVNAGTAGGCIPKTLNLVKSTPALNLTYPIFAFNNGTTFTDATTATANAEVASGIIDSNSEDGKPYAVEILQADPGTLPSSADGAGTTKPKYAAVLYTIDGWVDKDFRVTFTLNGASFDGEPLMGIANSNVAVGATTAPTGYYPFTSFNRGVSAAGKNTVYFDVSPADSDAKEQGAPDARLNNQSLILLLYRLQDATPLQAAGGQVTMDVAFRAFTADAEVLPVNRNLSTVLATSENSLDARLYDEDDGTIYISVNADSKTFTNTSDDATKLGAFQGTSVARIGYLELGPDKTTYQPDGVNLFTIGKDLGTAGEASQLVINVGQFAASKVNPGLVRLVAVNNDVTGAVIASVVSDDGATATFDLTDEELAEIYAADKVAIEFVADGVAEVNLVEAPPTATLSVVFDNEDIAMDPTLAETLVDVPLRQIFQDGVVCWAFNVPYATVQDRFNIRITNESSVPGSMSVTLYEASGTEIASGVELKNIQDANGQFIFPTLKSETELGKGTGTDKNLLPPGHTLFINSEILETALGAAWSGRAVLRIVSELPEVEMLAMLRNQLMDEASQALNNLSLGAHGISCVQGGQ